MNMLIVIPARGGSKGIPRKNVRLINGSPLISYSIHTAKELSQRYPIIDIVVTTDDQEIYFIAKNYGIFVIKRPEDLAEDNVTLDPVVYHAVNQMEIITQKSYDIIITMQPTSPTLKVQTLYQALEKFIHSGVDTMLSVVNRPKLTWKKENNTILPAYRKRQNRQQLPALYEETGGFLITKRCYITKTSRMGTEIDVFELPEQEGMDIDKEEELIACEALLKKKHIVFRVDGGEILGMEHIDRCLALAYRLVGNEISFVTASSDQFVLEELERSYFRVKQIQEEAQFFHFLREYEIDVVINDIGNTTEAYMENLRKLTKRIINLEDLGNGAGYADAVINVCCDNKERLSNLYSGYQYFCIQNEFISVIPSKFHEKVKNILIVLEKKETSNFIKKLYSICCQVKKEYAEIACYFILSDKNYPKDSIGSIEKEELYVCLDGKRISEYMKNADLAIALQGRTIYELAYMGIPSIILTSNEKEKAYLLEQFQNGFINLRLGTQQEEKTILSTLRWLIETPEIRYEMRAHLLSKEIGKGSERIMELIRK